MKDQEWEDQEKNEEMDMWIARFLAAHPHWRAAADNDEGELSCEAWGAMTQWLLAQPGAPLALVLTCEAMSFA